jgi:hypothetical protein
VGFTTAISKAKGSSDVKEEAELDKSAAKNCLARKTKLICHKIFRSHDYFEELSRFDENQHA